MTRRRVIISSLVVLVTAVALIYFSIPGEPSYHGRKLSAWIDDAQTKPTSARGDLLDDPKWVAATNAIKHIGADAVPCLLRWALSRDSATKKKFAAFIDNYGPNGWRMTPANERCRRATIGFHLLREQAEAAKPLLIEWSHSIDPERRIRGYYYLMNSATSGQEFFEVSDRLKQDNDPAVQRWRTAQSGSIAMGGDF